jgi:hypothetical protein
LFRVLTDSMDEKEFSSGSQPGQVDAALSRIPSTFGKLVLLANSGHSTESSQAEGARAVRERLERAAALKEKHQELFLGWLRLSLAAQTEEVAQYFARQGEGQNARIVELLDHWIEEKTYEKLAPSTARDQSRSLFCSDLKAILRLLRVQFGFSDENPDL